MFVIESIVQVADILYTKSFEQKKYSNTLLFDMEETKFRGMMKSGDTLKINVCVFKTSKLVIKIQDTAKEKKSSPSKSNTLL